MVHNNIISFDNWAQYLIFFIAFYVRLYINIYTVLMELVTGVRVDKIVTGRYTLINVFNRAIIITFRN